MESLTPGRAEDVMGADSTPVYEEHRKKWKEHGDKGGVFRIGHGNHQGSDFVIVEADAADAELADGAAADRAIELLKERASAGTPFFLAVGFVRPHVPLVAPRRSFAAYDADAMDLPDVPPDDLGDMPAAAKRQANAAKYKLTPEAQRKSLRGYYAAVSYMDEQVGRLLDTLDALDLRKDTIVVFVSDHGYHLGEHTMWQKMSLLEESIRVPLIVSVPGQRKTGATSASIVELIDLYPTLAGLAGLEVPASVQGRSFARLLDEPDAPGVREDALIQVGPDFCLRTDRWALMRYPSKGGSPPDFMLYDMENDPKQFTNLSGRAEWADTERRLRERLDERLRGSGGRAER